MKAKKILRVITLLIITLTLSALNLKAQDNYEIATEQQFIDLLLSENADMHGSYILVNDLDFTKGTVVYNGNTYELDSSGLEVTPIGEKKDENGVYQDSFHNPFKGSFNGAGHVIKGLNIRSKAIDNEYVGLFGYNEGIISNLGLVDSTVDGGVYVGGIAGYNIGIIIGCYNTSSITGNGSVGGITGVNYGYVRNCYNTGYVGGATKIGGIVGHNSSVITAVYDLGIISGQLTEEGTKEYGNIFGYNSPQGVIGYVEDENGPYQFISSQRYSIAGAYYCSEYDFGIGYNVGYLKNNERYYDNVKTYAKTLAELKDINNYDYGFKTARTNIYPIGSTFSHRTTGFFIKAPSGKFNYPFPVVGTSEYTTRHHHENSLHTNGFEGAGTIYNPFIIKNEEDLNNIRYSLTSAFKLANNITLTKSFVPIGDENNTFKGIFDGNGKRISNINIEDINRDYVGLFAFNSGIIHNVSLDVNINTPNASRVGGLAGFNNGQIREVYVQGQITGLNTVGGITGANELGSIKNSFNLAEIRGVTDIGGISGYNSGTIENVYSKTIPVLTNGVVGNVGGIVGFNEDSKGSGIIKNGYHITPYQIGYQSSIGQPYNIANSRFTSESDFSKIEKFQGFNIRLLNKGQQTNTIWAIEPGVNNGNAYLVNTPPIRIQMIDINYDIEFEINGKSLRLFDYDNHLILGADIYLDQVWIDLNSFLIINPNNAENKKVYWEVLYQMPNDGVSQVVKIEDHYILGVTTGRAYIRVTTDDGAKQIELEVYVLGNVTDVFLVDKENGNHTNPNDLVPDQIIMENYTNIRFYTVILPEESADSGIIWSSSNEQIASVDRFGNVYLHYPGSIDNPVINQNYTKEVKVTIRASSVDNILVFDEVTIIITPSNKTSLDSGLKVYEKGTNIPLSRSGNHYYFTDPHRLVRYDVEYLNLEFYTNYNQTYRIKSSHATENDSLVNGKNVYISKGELVGNTYQNRTNIITITIISESGLEENYTLEVTKELSSNKEIDKLNASYDQQTYLNYTYNNGVFTITSRIPYGTNRLYFNPTLANNNSIYTKSNFHKITFNLYNSTQEYEGYIDLPNQSGVIIVQMKVTAEDKTTKVYDIEVVIGYSNLDSLDGLFVGQLGQENLLNFNPNIHEYDINLPLRYLNNLLIQATPTLDESNRQASIIYIGVDQSKPVETNSILIDIMSGRTVQIFVQVQSEANYYLNIKEYNTYVINLHSEANNEALLYRIELNNNIIEIIEGIDSYSFTFTSSYDTDLLTTLQMRLVSSPWSTQQVIYVFYRDYFNNTQTNYNLTIQPSLGYYQIPFFQSGKYGFRIRIVAQNNVDVHEYFLEITKEPSSNAKTNYIDLIYQNKSILETLLIPTNTSQFTYNSINNSYTLIKEIKVPHSTNYVDINLDIYRYAKYRVNSDDRLYNSYEKARVDLYTSVNNLVIEVLSEDGKSKTTYILQIRREYNPNTPYRQEYYLQDFSGSYVLYETTYYSGTAYDEVFAIEKEFVGFTLNLNHYDTIKSGIILEDGSLVLKLYYTRNSYQFRVEPAKNGTVVSESGLIKYGYLINLQAIPNKGYIFDGWYLGDTLISLSPNYVYQMPAYDVALTARFSLRTYSLIYVLNGGINSSLNKDAYTINDLPLTIYEPTRVGYQFGGWYFTSDFIGNPINQITLDNIGDHVLYAYWILNDHSNYKVEYYLEDLKGNFVLEYVRNFNGLTHSEITITPENLPGFIFDASNNLNVLSGVIQEDGSLVLSLYYVRDSFILDLNNENPTYGYITGPTGTILYEQPITVGAMPNAGYRFVGWFINNELISSDLDYTFTMPAHNLEIKARFEIQTYNIYYYLDGGINHPDNPSQYTIESKLPIALHSPTKEGHTFLGWYLTSDFSGMPINELEIVELKDVHLYAKWVINTYEITFVTNSSHIVDSIILEYGQKIPRPSLYQIGYQLINWYQDDSFSTLWNFEEDRVTQNMILYAKWELVQYTITYYYNGGILADGVNNPTTYNIETENFVLHEPTKEGHSFDGWYRDADFSGERITEIKKGSYGNISLYAKFTIDTFEITILIRGRGRVESSLGTIENNILVVPYKSSFTLTLIPDDDFVLNSIKVNGEEIDLIDSLQFNEVTSDCLVEVEFVGEEPEILTLKPGSGYRDRVYSIDRSGEKALFLEYFINQPVSAIRDCFLNSPDRIKFYNTNDVELKDSDALGTGYKIKLFDKTYSEIIDEVVVVLLGDVNCDRIINVYDMQSIINHISLTKQITLPEELIAANVAKSNYINVFSVQELILHISQTKLIYG